MTTKHTPGPWVALGDHYDECVRVFNGDNNQICVFRYGADPDRRVTAMATARLIAAAPDLLAALKRVSGSSVTPDDINSARDAIAKAEGGSE